MPIDKNGQKVFIPIGDKVTVVRTFDNKLKIKHDSKYYSAEILKTVPLNVFGLRPNHPWANTYGQKIKDQKYGNIDK